MPMPEIKYRITDVRLTPGVTEDRVGKGDMMVSWVEDGVRPYVLRVPVESYTPEEGIRLVEAEVKKHSLIIGHEGTIGG